MRRSGLTGLDIAEYSEYLARVSTLVVPARIPEGLLRDPTDEPVLGTALAGKAEVICTRDADVFAEKVQLFGAAKGIRVLTEMELLHWLGIQS